MVYVHRKSSVNAKHDREVLPYLLGSGKTCSVSQHETDKTTLKVVPSGTIVALKRYIQQRTSSQADEALESQRLYRVVWQDLAVCSHPYLKTHENISRLLFVAWQDDSPIPAFAFELAEYGTLERLILDSGSLFTDQIRSHLSLDLVTGLAALHFCDFVHGDLKPANTLIYRHESRELVARLSDFAGAATVREFGTGSHYGFATREWLAPEVLDHSANIDWQKADVYGAGLVLAHLW